ncbi:hypothetical protein ILYODFUR_038395 [Ilyodon furcidens]|uniref:Secreted protein n=1 Tax=Ilyodon furcidens TaxID=33524 RepID=A0ABV0U165_9TELE
MTLHELVLCVCLCSVSLTSSLFLLNIHCITKGTGSHHQITEFWCYIDLCCCRCTNFGVEKLEWPAQCPDLNLLGYIWDELEWSLHFWFSHPNIKHTSKH